jgi:hypothetical protein
MTQRGWRCPLGDSDFHRDEGEHPATWAVQVAEHLLAHVLEMEFVLPPGSHRTTSEVTDHSCQSLIPQQATQIAATALAGSWIECAEQRQGFLQTEEMNRIGQKAETESQRCVEGACSLAGEGRAREGAIRRKRTRPWRRAEVGGLC